MPHTHTKKILIHKMSITNYLMVHALFFNIGAAIVQAFLKSGYKPLYTTVIEVYCLLSKPHFNFDFDLIIVGKVLPYKMFV